MAKYIRLDQLVKIKPQYIKELQQMDCLVVGRNKVSQNKQTFRFQTLYQSNSHFWNTGGDWEYYIRSDFITEIRQRKKKKGSLRSVSEVMGEKYEEFQDMSPRDRNNQLVVSIEKIEQLLHKKKASSREISEALINGSVNGALINKITLEDHQDDMESKFHAVNISKTTSALMDGLIDVIARDFSYSDTLSIIDNTVGGITLKHMARVFIQTMTFLDYINHQVEYCGLNTSLIGRFPQYKDLYSPLFPKLKPHDITLHRILLEPIKISDNLLRDICLGIMLHDIGKQKNYCYFESDSDYDRKIIESHAFDGYVMIMKRNIYNEEIAAIAGMHHEYYGADSGYGIYRERLEDQLGTEGEKQHFSGVMTLDYSKIRRTNALAYFPAKIVEIIDVYDALIDPAREYKDPLTPLESLKLMRKTMIMDQLKIDPILFDLYVKMLQQKEVLV